MEEISGLGRKLAVILVQLPASLTFESRAAGKFFESLSVCGHVRVACEPRHPTWFSVRAGKFLQRHGIARVAADPPPLPTGGQPGGSTNLIYYRLHGSPKKYYSAYDAVFLARLAAQIGAASSIADEVWCIFDNTARYQAWPNARDLSRLLD